MRGFMKTALQAIKSQRARPGREACSSAKGCNRSHATAGDDYWREYSRVIGGIEVRFSPRVAEILARDGIREGKQ